MRISDCAETESLKIQFGRSNKPARQACKPVRQQSAYQLTLLALCRTGLTPVRRERHCHFFRL